MTNPPPLPGTLPGYPAADFLPPAGIYLVASTSTGTLVASGRYLLLGWSLHNAATVAATAQLFDGRSAAGQAWVTIRAAAGNDDRMTFTGRGIEVRDGVYLSPVTGTWSGSLFLIPYPPGA